MVFSSLAFICAFLPVVFLLNQLIPRHKGILAYIPAFTFAHPVGMTHHL